MAQIKSKEQYDAIMARIDELFFATDENTPKSDKRLLELDALSALVEEYEKEHFPIEPPTLPATIVARMNERDYTQKDLADLLGISAPRLCDIIGGKKKPTYDQARTISMKLDIDPSIVLAL